MHDLGLLEVQEMKTARQFFTETLKAEGPRFVRVLKAIPADKAAYKPHERCSSGRWAAPLKTTMRARTCRSAGQGGRYRFATPR